MKNKVRTVRKALRNSYKHKATKIDNYVIDKKLSGKRTQVFYDPQAKEQLIVHRGTKGINDIFTDGLLALGLLETTNRFKHAKHVANEAATKRPEYKTTQIGHSLGGAIARGVAKPKENVITYNTAVSPVDFFRQGQGKETNIRSKYDPISMLAPLALSNITTLPGNSHSFGPLKDKNITKFA